MATEERRINGRPISTHYSVAGNGNGWEVQELDWNLLLRSGPITVSSVEHRRLLEDVGCDDNERIRYVNEAKDHGDAQEADTDG